MSVALPFMIHIVLWLVYYANCTHLLQDFSNMAKLRNAAEDNFTVLGINPQLR